MKWTQPMKRSRAAFRAGEPPSGAGAHCRVRSGRAFEHAIACGEVSGACSDLKLHWSAEICAQITAQTEKILGQVNLEIIIN
jgi:hypothetical protein